MPDVSVITPIYNGMPYLEEAIASVLQQDCDFELLLVDDGSTDGSIEAVAEYARMDSRVRLICQEHGGIAAALNLGLKHSAGPVVAIAEQDDRSAPDRLRKQLEVLDARPDVVLVSSWAYYVGSLGKRRGMAMAGPCSEAEFLRAKTDGSIHIVSPTAMFRLEAALSLGGFDSNFDGCQDEHLWNRLADLGCIHTIAEPLVDYRLHSKSASVGSSLRQTAFPAYWAARKSIPSAQSLDEFINSTKSDDLVAYFALVRKALGYSSIRKAGAFLADGRTLQAVPFLALGSLMNPKIAVRQINRRLSRHSRRCVVRSNPDTDSD